jgi:hypothetical protein
MFNFISASFALGGTNYSIENSYGEDQDLNGWINISFNEELGNSTINASYGDAIELLDLLRKNSNKNFEYICDPVTCTERYEKEGREISVETFNLNAGKNSLFGIKIEGEDISKIKEFKFNLKSNNSEEDNLPLAIDILNDGKNEWEAYKSSESYGDKKYGGWIEDSYKGENASITDDTFYCEKINLKRAPAVSIGAYVEGTETNVNFELKITNIASEKSGTCIATATGRGAINCTVEDYPIEEGDYFVCIKTEESGDDEKYEIKTEEENVQGFAGNYNGVYTRDFKIFAMQKKYASDINITLNNTEIKNAGSSVSKLEDYIQDYINTNYNKNCSSGCIIPIKIVSGINQQINISELLLGYIESETTLNKKKFYTLSSHPPKINSTFQKLYLDEAGLNIPNVKGDYNISVFLNKKELFKSPIIVGEIPKILWVSPLRTAKNYPTLFFAGITSKFNITEYHWNFGDNHAEKSSNNQITHTYKERGNYNITLTVKDLKGKTALKNFSVEISSASEIVPSLLGNATENAKTIEEEIKEKFTGFTKTSIENAIDIEGIKDKLLVLKGLKEKATDELEWEKILEELLVLNIPKSLSETASGKGIYFYPEEDVINLDILKTIGEGSYAIGKEEAYRKAILSYEDIETTLSFKEISSNYDDHQERTLIIFDLSIKNIGTEPVYFIIKDIDNLLFKTDYSLTEREGYYYLLINDTNTHNITFSTTREINFLNLPVFISPSLREIIPADIIDYNDEEDGSKWITFTIIVFFVIIGIFVVYLILQIWYRKNYENYLFKNKNNLYNLLNYIKSSKDKKIKDKEIEESLKKVGWNSEQIRYAMKKYHGKNTGMPEIPIKKIISKKKE